MIKRNVAHVDPNESGYQHEAGFNDSHGYLFPAVLPLINGPRVLDAGCGNGIIANEISQLGHDVTAVDISAEGVELAARHLTLKVVQRSLYVDLTDLGKFDTILSLGVVEHLYAPRIFLDRIRDVLSPEGRLILSTPYHGYWKNLAIALTDKFDSHVDPLSDHGHIKFWSIPTITQLLNESGFGVSQVLRVDRIPVAAKSMILVAHRLSPSE